MSILMKAFNNDEPAYVEYATDCIVGVNLNLSNFDVKATEGNWSIGKLGNNDSNSVWASEASGQGQCDKVSD